MLLLGLPLARSCSRFRPTLVRHCSEDGLTIPAPRSCYLTSFFDIILGQRTCWAAQFSAVSVVLEYIGIADREREKLSEAGYIHQLSQKNTPSDTTLSLPFSADAVLRVHRQSFSQDEF
jgi:hypothetical protein